MFKGEPYSGESETGANEKGHLHSQQAWIAAQEMVVGYLPEESSTSIERKLSRD